MATDDLMDDIHVLSGAYALDALDPVERDRYEAHLATCDRCPAEVAAFRETAALLAVADEVAPPAGLRDRVLAGIADLAPETAPESPFVGAHRLDVPAAPEPQASDERAVVVPLRRRPQRRWLAAGIAAAVALVLGIGIGAVQPWPHHQVVSTERILAASDAQHVTEQIGGGRVEIVRSASVGGAVALFDGVRTLSGSRQYQLWLVPKGSTTPVSAGLVGRGDADQAVLLHGDAATAVKAAVSREPAGGSPQPTTQPIYFKFPTA